MSDMISRLDAALEDRYRVEDEIGHGGMATVYRADDLRHDRKVAIKVLRPDLAAVLGADRFLTEIKTTANLNHPHILPLFDSGAADGLLYYVMPYIEGESLRDRLDRERQLPVDEAVRIARAAASALDYAHRHDVLHRDIKPANILLHDGEPVVADFGIALAVSAAGGGRLTETGLSLGTPHYMSPEQASADRNLTAHSDVYSLGCVLYEMLAGDPPHTGPTAQAVLMRILTEEPRPITEVRRAVPPHVAATLAKALEKLPADRFPSAAAFDAALADPTFVYSAARRTGQLGTAPRELRADASGPTATRLWIRDRRTQLALAVLGIVTVAAGLTLAANDSGSEAPARAPVTRVEIPLEGLAVPSHMALSPDGSMLVFASQPLEDEGQGRLHLRRSDDVSIRPLADSEGATEPAFSPDGTWIAFVAANRQELKRIPAEGGRPTVVTTLGPFIRDVHWAEGGTIFFSGIQGLFRVPFTGGDPEQILVSEPWAARHPRPLPGGDQVLFTHHPLNAAKGEVRILDLDSGEVATLVAPGGDARYVEVARTGYVLFGSEGALFAAPFAPRRGELAGPTIPVLDMVSAEPAGGPVHFELSRSGTAVLALGPAVEALSRLVTLTLDGQEEPLPLAPAVYSGPRYSPDARKLAYLAGADIRIYDLVTGGQDLLAGGGTHVHLAWSLDASRIAFSTTMPTGGTNLSVRPTDLSAPAERITEAEGFVLPLTWTPDGEHILVSIAEALGAEPDLHVLDLATGTTRPYLEGPWTEEAGDLSPNGRWVAYESNEDGSFEVYVRSFPEPGARHAVSRGGGLGARWSSDGRRILYRKVDTLMVAEVRADSTFQVLSRRQLFAGPYRGVQLHPDGNRILAIKQPREAPTGAERKLFLVVNWIEEMRAKLGL